MTKDFEWRTGTPENIRILENFYNLFCGWETVSDTFGPPCIYTHICTSCDAMSVLNFYISILAAYSVQLATGQEKCENLFLTKTWKPDRTSARQWVRKFVARKASISIFKTNQLSSVRLERPNRYSSAFLAVFLLNSRHFLERKLCYNHPVNRFGGFCKVPFQDCGG